MEPEIIQHFVESVGQKADVDLYLKHFRAQRKESFAIIVADAQIVKTALDPFHFDLRILTGLGLVPVVVLGVFDAKDADRQAGRVLEWLTEDAVAARVIPSGATDLSAARIEEVRTTVLGNTIPILSLEGARDLTTEARFGQLQALATSLETRKVIFLSTGSGLQRDGAPYLSVVNLPTDAERLLAPGVLGRRSSQILRQSSQLLERTPHRLNVAVVNPLGLLRELFTVAGAGTLIRLGSRIDVRPGLDGVDGARLRQLLESAFGRAMREGSLDHQFERSYVEERYLGAVLLERTPAGAYLSKFAVERQAQGEGIGGDLWSALTRDYQSFFWRARPTNPIVPWYARQCDGLVRLPDWHVYWKNLNVSEIEPAVRYALAAPVDFPMAKSSA